MRIYLDVCCLNRPFDDWSQERVRLEGDAIVCIMERVRSGEWQLISSEAVMVELGRMSNLEKKARILELLNLATFSQAINDEIDARSQQLESYGFGLFDAIHVACAEAASASIFLSTDDRLLKAASRNRNFIRVQVSNPAIWLVNFLQF